MRWIIMFCAVALVACSSRVESKAVALDDVRELRRFTIPLGSPTPQVAWSPDSRWVLAMEERGIALLREGTSRRQDFGGGRQLAWPTWISPTQGMIGSRYSYIRNDNGRIIEPTEPVALFDVNPTRGFEKARALGDAVGWRPLIWNERIVLQIADQVWLYDELGEGAPYDEGFCPMPQRNGPGIMVQTKPMTSPDYWQGGRVLGDLVVRWDEDKASVYPALVEAEWASQSMVVATRLLAAPSNYEQWWQAGTETVIIPEVDAKPIVLLAGSRMPHKNPALPIVAVVDQGDNVVLVHADGSGIWREVGPGLRPRWSPDGRKLCVEIPAQNGLGKDLQFIVFGF